MHVREVRFGDIRIDDDDGARASVRLVHSIQRACVIGAVETGLNDHAAFEPQFDGRPPIVVPARVGRRDVPDRPERILRDRADDMHVRIASA